MEKENLNNQETAHLRQTDVSSSPSINFFNVDCIEFMKSKPDKQYFVIKLGERVKEEKK